MLPLPFAAQSGTVSLASQDHGDHKVVDRADAHADGDRHEEQTVEQVAALLLGAAGAQDQKAAGGEGEMAELWAPRTVQVNRAAGFRPAAAL